MTSKITTTKITKITEQIAYEILGIEYDNTQQKIITTSMLKQAYKQIATSLQTAQNNKEKLRVLNEAYRFLKEGLGNEPPHNALIASTKDGLLCSSLPQQPTIQSAKDVFLRSPIIIAPTPVVPTINNNSNSDEDTENNHKPTQRRIIIKQKADILNETVSTPTTNQPLINVERPVGMPDINNIFPQIKSATANDISTDLSQPLSTIHFVDLTLDEINNGLTKKLVINVKMPCPTCASTVSLTMSNKILRSINRCNTCFGFGMVYESIEKTIVIPKMFDITTKTEYEQEGDCNPATGVRDNIIIKYRLSEKEPYLVKNGHDLFCLHFINIFDAWNGLSIFLHGYHFTFSGVVKDGETLYCENMGLPKSNGETGKLLIKFKYIYPKKQPASEGEYVKFLKQKENNDGKTSSHKTRKLHRMANQEDDDIFGEESDELYEK
jgi:DnaJ-class molecular chaperone